MTTVIKKTDEIQEFLIFEDDYIINAIKKLNKTKKKILFVINKKKKLTGSLSDGDLRYGLQKNLGLNEKIKKFSNKKIKFFYQSQKKIIDFNKLKILDMCQLLISIKKF